MAKPRAEPRRLSRGSSKGQEERVQPGVSTTSSAALAVDHFNLSCFGARPPARAAPSRCHPLLPFPVKAGLPLPGTCLAPWGGGPGRAPTPALLSPSPPPSSAISSQGLHLPPRCAPADCHADAKLSLSPLPISSTTSPIFSPLARRRLPAWRCTFGEQSILPRGSRLQRWLPASHIPPCSEPAHPHRGRRCPQLRGHSSGLDAQKHFPLGA